LFEWKKNIYDKSIDIFLKKFIREEKKFKSLDKLADQLKIDKENCLIMLNEKQ